MTVLNSAQSDVLIVGAGVMGCSTALHLAKAGQRVAVIDRGPICREASGVNAGTLTMHMTRAALIPYALEGWRMWQDASAWLGHDLAVQATEGLTVAFTEHEVAMLESRATARKEAGAPIELINPKQARTIEPGLSDNVIAAARCPVDGFNTPYLLGRAFRHALQQANAELHENRQVVSIEREENTFVALLADGARLRARRLVLAGGVSLEPMLAWLGVSIPVKTLVNQLVVTERLPKVMRTVCSVASGLLSLKQFENGSVLIGGGWQGRGDRISGETEVVPESFTGNVRLATYTIPAVGKGRLVRTWLGFEAETSDALPLLGSVPGVPDAYAIGSVHSGYTSGPYMGKLLASHMLGEERKHRLFEPARLLRKTNHNEQGA